MGEHEQEPGDELSVEELEGAAGGAEDKDAVSNTNCVAGCGNTNCVSGCGGSG